jgi:hypothetical protein
MQLALLVQVHDMLQSAAITAIGSVHQIIELKSNSEIELNDIIWCIRNTGTRKHTRCISQITCANC